MFTSDGTWTAPAGVEYVQVQMLGAGGTAGDSWGLGTGGSGGGGGGGGGYVQAVVKVTPGTAYPVVVGLVANGGVGSCSGRPGIKGGDSTFNGLVAGGGYGGANAGTQSPFPPGAGASGGGVSAGPASYFGGNGGNGSSASGGTGGAPGAPFPTVMGRGGVSTNCQPPNPPPPAMSGFVRINW